MRPARLSARVRALTSDPVSLALLGVFLLGSVFYFWRATFAEPLALQGGQSSQYNQLADAFLHLHLWVVHIPEGVLGSGNPYNPAERPAFLFNYPDYSLYGRYLYLEWGPAPVLVWLVPLHLLGFEPSASVISTPFAIVGLGFALATLRIVLRKIGSARLWMCILAALTLTCASGMPYIVRFPLVYHEAVAAGYCFAMVGIWSAVSAVVDRRGSLKRLILMGVSFGLATASRPTLGLTGLLLIPVYMSLRSTRPRHELLAALVAPFGVCLLLLASYNEARFGNPLEFGTKYQITGVSTYTAHFGKISFLPPGLWAYLFSPPRLSALFPFLLINYPQVSYPLGLPAHYISISEETGGLLTMAPIAVFLVALPWVWRHRPASLGPLAPLLLAMAGAGLACMIFLAYDFYTTSERYETDYMTLLLFGGVAVWLVLSSDNQIRGRRLIRIGGGMLAVWGCLTGMAISYEEIERHAGTWRTLVNLSSPLSTAIATVAGHPVLAEVFTPELQRSPPSYANIGTEATGFSLAAGAEADLTIVSPDSREDALVANTYTRPAFGSGAPLEVRLDGPGNMSHVYQLPGGGGRGRIPVHLNRGVNQVVLRPVGSAAGSVSRPESESQPVITFTNFKLAG
jgi:hypothetical protein